MTINWEAKDIEGGLIVAQKSVKETYTAPLIIGWQGQEPDTKWGLVDLRDGMFIPYGSKQKLAEILTAGGYALCNKFIGKHDWSKHCENRLQFPVVSITNVG